MSTSANFPFPHRLVTFPPIQTLRHPNFSHRFIRLLHNTQLMPVFLSQFVLNKRQHQSDLGKTSQASSCLLKYILLVMTNDFHNRMFSATDLHNGHKLFCFCSMAIQSFIHPSSWTKTPNTP